MNIRLLIALIALIGSFGFAQGCYYEEAPEDDDGGSATSGAGGAQAAQPGARCNCDTDCAGEGAICFLGMCALRAEGWCPTHLSEAGCGEGFRCINSDIVTTGGVCFPLYDAATCAVVENRDGLCSPTRADICDPSCGTACVAETTVEGTAGAACVADSQCGFHAEASCYADDGGSEPNGWVEGYCLSFGCTTNEECGDPSKKGCYPVATDGSGVCMDSCHMDLDCRWGYRCRQRDEMMGPGMCFAGCDAAALCPGGFVCTGGLCVDENKACSESNPSGWCPDGSWCDKGVCNEQPFACDGNDDALEPNDSRGAAADAKEGVTNGLYSCAGNEDWYRVTVPEGKVVRVGIEFSHNAGDLDLVAYDAAGKLMGGRIGESYPYAYRDQETDTEYFGFYSEKGTATYYVRALGYGSANAPLAENIYNLHVDSFDYKDGAVCSDLFSTEECIGKATGGAKLIPFSFPDPNDSYLPEQFLWDTYSNYRFARRELVMLVRHALHETYKAFPSSNPLGLIDVCQKDGITPGYDVGSPRHPETTHDQGGNIDIAYFQTDGNNSAEVICGDGSKHADGFCSSAATEKHIVDLPRQAYFMAQLCASDRTRVIGADKVIGPLIVQAANDLHALSPSDPKHITASQLSSLKSRTTWGDGWPYHHHHIHLSMQWWTSGAHHTPPPDAPHAGSGHGHQMMRPDVVRRYAGEPAPSRFTLHNMKWPPRPR